VGDVVPESLSGGNEKATRDDTKKCREGGNLWAGRVDEKIRGSKGE